MMTVGKIGVHEFITLDGVIGDPSWSFDYSFDPKMGEAIGGIMESRPTATESCTSPTRSPLPVMSEA
jgi:hypothetical protein